MLHAQDNGSANMIALLLIKWINANCRLLRACKQVKYEKQIFQYVCKAEPAAALHLTVI